MNDSGLLSADVRGLARDAVSLGDRYRDLFDRALLAIYV